MTAVKRLLYIVLAILPTVLQGQILKPEGQHIPGHYEYTHSWDYAAPDGNGTIHCDETGTLDFYADGTFADTALQHHTLHTRNMVKDGGDKDTSSYIFNFMYYCQGRWGVENGKFRFCEHAEGFDMVLQNKNATPEIVEYADMIEKKTLPNSSRWFTFDIERLDNEWFIWTYTYPNSRKDSWEMRVQLQTPVFRRRFVTGGRKRI